MAQAGEVVIVNLAETKRVYTGYKEDITDYSEAQRRTMYVVRR
jgi:hypothetical protein